MHSVSTPLNDDLSQEWFSKVPIMQFRSWIDELTAKIYISVQINMRPPAGEVTIVSWDHNNCLASLIQP